MNLNDLLTFKVVAEEKNISKAAEKLHFVQSNITAKIKRLEKTYETQLFYRHRYGVTLTSAGRILLAYTEQILQLMDDSKKAITYAKTPTGTLAIGAMETTAAVRLPSLLATYKQKYPEVALALQTNSTNTLIKKVIDRELEGAFIAGSVHHPLITEIEAFNEQLVLIAKKDEFALNDIKKQTIIVFQSGCFYRKVLEDWLRSEGIIPTHTMELNTLEGIVGCVKAGLGISMLTKTVMEQLDPHKELVQYPLPINDGNITTKFIYHKNIVKTAAFEAFVKRLMEK